MRLDRGQPDGSTVEKTGYISNYVVDSGGRCLAAVLQHVRGTTLPGGVAAGVQTVTPASMVGIESGTSLVVDVKSTQESVTVTGIVVAAAGPTVSSPRSPATRPGRRRVRHEQVPDLHRSGRQCGAAGHREPRRYGCLRLDGESGQSRSGGDGPQTMSRSW